MNPVIIKYLHKKSKMLDECGVIQMIFVLIKDGTQV